MRASAFLRGSGGGAAAATAATAVLTGLLVPFRDEVGLLNQGLLFLLLTLLVASVWGRNAGFFAALISNLSLNFFFIQPYYTFVVDDLKSVVALFIFLVVTEAAGRSRLRLKAQDLRAHRRLSGWRFADSVAAG